MGARTSWTWSAPLGGTLAFADCSLKVDDAEVVRARAVFAALS